MFDRAFVSDVNNSTIHAIAHTSSSSNNDRQTKIVILELSRPAKGERFLIIFTMALNSFLYHTWRWKYAQGNEPFRDWKISLKFGAATVLLHDYHRRIRVNRVLAERFTNRALAARWIRFQMANGDYYTPHLHTTPGPAHMTSSSLSLTCHQFHFPAEADRPGDVPHGVCCMQSADARQMLKMLNQCRHTGFSRQWTTGDWTNKQ